MSLSSQASCVEEGPSPRVSCCGAFPAGTRVLQLQEAAAAAALSLPSAGRADCAEPVSLSGSLTSASSCCVDGSAGCLGRAGYSLAAR